jgi:hypothetical protein
MVGAVIVLLLLGGLPPHDLLLERHAGQGAGFADRQFPSAQSGLQLRAKTSGW